jgi:Rnl2 family RNA ligase
MLGCVIWCGVPTPVIIGQGTFEEMLALPQSFRSTLTPAGYEGQNEAEGITVQPAIPKWLKNGNRVWLKKKAPAFSEKKERTTHIPTPLPDDITQVLNDLLVYNTSNRVSNVISKIGNVTTKDFGKILGLTVKDMLEDYDKEHEVPFHVSTEKHYKSAVKILNSEVSTVVRVEFVKHLEEEND